MATNDFSVQSANHTGFTVASLDSALAFWHGLLGLPIIGRRQLDLGAEPNAVGVANAKMELALLALPGGHNVELLEYTSPDGRNAVQPRPCDVGHIHLAINVKNCAGLITEAKKIGWTPAANEPVQIKRHDGQVWNICYIRSPEGQTVELMEKMES
jgi:catechol 2,3-dioxygenase-like lactoylglutathione lyase family enzyme